MKKIVNVVLTIFSWVLVGLYLLLGIAYISSSTGIIFFLLALLTMPISPIKNVWTKILKFRIFKYLVLFVFFIVAVYITPVSTLEQDNTFTETNIEPVNALESVDIFHTSESDDIEHNSNDNSKIVENENSTILVEKSEEQNNLESETMSSSVGNAEKGENSEDIIENNISNNNLQTLGDLEVHFIDVGQGDCTIILCENEAMIIDAGPDSVGTKVQKYLMDLGIYSLKYVVITHPDADHIGGMDVVIYKFDCNTIFMTGHEKETRVYQSLMETLKSKSYKITAPVVGDVYQIGTASFQIISPALDYSEDNNNSIVIRLDHGNNHFLFTGDAEVQAQQEMSYGGYDICANVMKIPHHGGKSGLQEWFYKEVNPEYAIVSCGKDNEYGHPHEEVLNVLKNNNIKVFRTDEQNTIVAKSNGETIVFDKIPSTTWKPGYVESRAEIISIADFVDLTNDDNTQIIEDRSIPIQDADTVDDNLVSGQYVVNGKNGKIHIRGKCSATNPASKQHMKQPISCDSFAEAISESKKIDASLSENKRKCGNCYK